MAHGPLADVDHDAVVAEGGRNAHHHEDGQLDDLPGQAAEIRVDAADQRHDVVVHQGLGEGGGQYSGHRRDQNTHNDQGKHGSVVVEHIAQNPVQDPHGAPIAFGLILHNETSLCYAGWSKSPPPLTWES